MNANATKPTALVTGAAKRIGASIAEHLAATGYNLVIHYHRSHSAAEELATDLTTRYHCMVTLKQADLADPISLEDFWNDVPPCELLIHNASRFARDTLESMTPASLRHHLTVHLESPLILTQGFMAQLPTDTQGNIILLSDAMLGWSIAPQFFSYAASKYAWHSIIDVLAAACAPRARANIIALGATLMGEDDTDELFARLATRAPLKRNGDPSEVCTAIDFLLASPGTTGQVISLANGYNLAAARPV